MGNISSNLNSSTSEVTSKPTKRTGLGINPSDSLRYKTGLRHDPFPYPPSKLPFDKLVLEFDFKTHLYRHLDSDYFLCCLLQNATDNTVLLDGIDFYNFADTSLREDTLKKISSFNQIVNAGVKVSLSDLLNFSECSVRLQFETRPSPFLKSFQRRLAAIRGLHDCLVSERLAAKADKKRRLYSEQLLSSKKYPQLFIIDGLKRTGLTLLSVLPKCLEMAHASGINPDFVTDAVHELADVMFQTDDKVMFSAWSPMPQLSLLPISVDSLVAEAASGVPSLALDTSLETFWTPAIASSAASCSWSVNLRSRTAVEYLSVVWSSNVPGSVCGAPKTLVIYLKIDQESAPKER